MRDCVNVGIVVSDKNEVCTNFLPGYTAEGRRTGVEPLNLDIIHNMHHLRSDIFEMCGHLEYVLL